MKYSNTIEYNITTKLDSSGLTKMQNQIREVELSLQRMGNSQGGFFAGQVEQARKELQGLNKALTEAFNPSLGIIDISKFRAELVKGKVDSEGLASAFRLAGTDGQVAFNNLISQLGTFDAGMQRTSSAVDKMWTTFQNTFRWGLVSSFFSQFMNAIHSSVDYVKELDDSLTQIMLVTDYNRDSMNQFAKSANEAAKAVSMTTTGMTNASLIFAQQGYDLGQSQELATLSAKLANASQQDTATTSDQITAYMNAYGLQNSMEELTQQMDNWAKIANVSAADVGELAQASQRAASMANTVGVSGETLAAQIATIESVTREAPEQIGNGLKTLYARFSDISGGGKDEDGVDLGKVTAQLDAIGVKVLDQFGNIRTMDNIMEDLMDVWTDLDDTAKIAAAQSLAGKYQVNRFVALMDNRDMYEEYVGATGSVATGTLDQMNEEYADSIAGRTAKMQATLEGIFSSIFDTDAIYPFVDAMQTFLDLVQKFVDAIGGAGPVITGVISLIGRLFSKNIANAFVDNKINNNLAKIQAENYKNAPAAIAQLGLSNPNPDNQNTKALLSFAEEGAKLAPNMSEQSLQNYNNLLKENTQLSNQAAAAQQNFEDVLTKANAELGINLNGKDSIIKDETGLNLSPLIDILQTASQNEQFGQSPDEWKKAEEAVSSYREQLDLLHHELEKYSKIENPNDEATNQVKERIQALKSEIDSLRGSSIQSSESIDQIENSIDALSETLDKADRQTDDWEQELKDSSASIERLQNNASVLIKILAELERTGGIKDKTGIQNLLDEIYAAQSKAVATQGAAQGGQRQMTSFISDMKDVDRVKNIVDTTSAIGELAFAWQSFQHLGSLWSNEDLSAGEKLLQTIINITMAMSQLLPVIDKLNVGQKITGLFSSDETKNSLETVKTEISDVTKEIAKQKEILNSIKPLEEQRVALNEKVNQIQGKTFSHAKGVTDLGKQKLELDRQIKSLTDQINKATEDGKITEEALRALEEQRNAKIVQRNVLEKRTTAELAKQQMMAAALNIGLGIVIAAIAAGIGAIQEQERKRIQKITDDAADSRSKLEAINSSEFFEQWDSFKENGELTDELKDSMAALAQQMGINIEAQDIYAGNIEQLNDKIRDNIELEKERARTNFETENEEFETQLNKNSIQAAQVGGSVTTASGTFNSAVDYIEQAGAAKSLAERLGEVANAETAVATARKEFGKDSLEYNNALNNYQKLKNQLKDDEVDIDKAKNNFKQLANLAVEEFKAGRDAQSITGADWIDFLNGDSDNSAAVREYMESLGKDAALQFKLGLLSQSDSENPLYSMIKGPGQIDLSNANLDMQNTTEMDLLSDFIDMGGTFEDLGFEGYEDFSKALIEAANNQVITLSPQINLESKYDFDSDEEIDEYLKNNTDIDRNVLDTSTELRMQHARDNGYEEHNKYNGEKDYWENEVNKLSQERDEMNGEQRGNWDNEERIKKTEELTEAQEKLNEVIKDAEKDDKAYEKSLQKAAAAAARASKTLDKMNDHFDDNKEILEEGNETTIEYAEALTETKEDLAGLLDVDLETIPTSLAKNPAILEDMNTILHGTQEEADAAYQHLTELASSEIIDNMEFDIPVDLTQNGQSVTTESIRETLHGLVDALNAQSDLGIDVEADVNTTEWYNKINELLASGALTADQLTQILSAAGYEGQFDTKTEMGKVPVTQYHVEVGELTTMGEPPNTISFPGSFTMTPETTYEEQEVTVPVLTGATQKNPLSGGTSGGGQHGGGGGGGGGKGKSCFVVGTLISTSLGFKSIEQIQKGDIVLSYNEQLGLNEYSEVLQTMVHDTIEPIYTLYIKDEQLRVTGIHRFLVTDKITCGIPQWVHAADLKVGQWVLFADGTWHIIHKIKINVEHQIVYNFEVSGNHNYYVGRNQILAHNKGGSGKKDGGKKKEIKPKEKREHEKDYYEEVNSQLDKTEKILSKIEKEEDRLIGDKARANQNKQLKLLQKEIDLNEKKLKIQKRELKDVDALIKKEDKRAEKAALNAGVRANIPGVVLDEDGVVSNYEQISKAIDKTYNDLVKKYNEAAKKGNEKLAEKIEKQMSEFDDYSKNLLEQIKRHNKLQGEIVETEDDLESLADTMEDISIDAYKASQEAVDNLKEIRESAAELDKFFRNFDDSSFMNKFSIDDTPYGDLIEDLSKLDNIYSVTKEDANAFYQDLINQKEKALKKTKDEDEKQAIQKSIDFFTEQQGKLKDGANLDNGLLGLAQQDLARLQGWIDNPKAKDNIYGDNEAALFEAYQEAYKRTLGLFKDYRELVQSTRDDILDIYSDAEEAIERQIDQFDRLSEKMERISDTYTLYYGEDSYDQLNQFYAQQGNIMQNQLNQLTAAYDLWKTRYEQAVKTGDEEIIKKTKDLMDDAEDAMLDAAQDLAELWVEKFENAVEASSQHIYKDLFGSNDIDELTDNWELQKDYMDRYKDDVEKAYEVDKLRNKYLDLLDDAQGSSVQTQNRIRQQMQEQLDLLNGQATVSEYDVKLANAKLEILQKQIALEDAQRNKNKMQLRRDTQGNYRYVYTADQGNVREAQQDLADSEYDAYEMTKEETVNNNDRAINLLQDYVEKRAAIWNKYKDDATALGINLANLEAKYGDSFEALAEDFTNTSTGMYDVLNWLVKNGSADTTTAALSMLDALYDKNGEVKDKTGQDWMDMANLITDQVLPNIESAVTKADLEMKDQAVELKESMVGPDGALTKIGSGADDVANSMDKATDATRTLATATDDLFTALGADDGKLQEALDKLAEYEKQLRQTQQTTSDLSKQLNEANKTIAAKNAEALNYKTILDYQSGAKKFKVGQVVTLKKGTWVSYHRDGDQYDSNGDNGLRLRKDTQVKISHVNERHTNGYGDTSQLAKYNIGFYEVGKEPTKESGTGMANKSDTKKTERWHLNESMLKQALTYDTGGYTGEWSNDESNLSKNGKLAVLHQKELVLNATDTENILAAITLMRDITQSTMGGLTNIGKVFSTNFSSAFNPTTEQRVEIQASFPNATDAEDIRAALLNLSDKAYQYANRTI